VATSACSVLGPVPGVTRHADDAGPHAVLPADVETVGHAEARGLIGEVVAIGVRGDARHGKGNEDHRRAEPEEEPEAASVGCGDGCVDPRHVDPYALVGR
jgi:hypothetical protein